MSAGAQGREMASERIAPGMLPRDLNSFDMTVIFVAIVLFIVNASALQPAGQAAFTFPEKFAAVRAAHPYLLYASGVVGILASGFGAYVTFRSPWIPLFSSGNWRRWLGSLCGVSALTAVVIYAISELVHRRARARERIVAT